MSMPHDPFAQHFEAHRQQEEEQHQQQQQQQQHHELPLSHLPFVPAGDLFENDIFTHLYESHGQDQQCIQPCMLSNVGLDKCFMPYWPHAHPEQNNFVCQPPSYDHPVEDNFCQVPPHAQSPDAECGKAIDSPSQLIAHFNAQHRPVFAASHIPHPAGDFSFTPTLPHRQARHEPYPSRPSTSSTRSMHGTTSSRRSSSVSTIIHTSISDDQTGSSPFTPISDPTEHRCLWIDLKTGQPCGELFATNNDLHAHCVEQHTANLESEDGGYRCHWSSCSRPDSHRFAQKSKLDRHIQGHTGHKPVECDICHIKLSAKQSLEQHRRIHTGDKPWKCDHPGCSKQFKQQSALTMHKRTHTGFRPLVCNICGKRFSESSNLSKHRKTHNSVGQYKCQHCDKTFHRQDQYRKHLRTHEAKKGAGGDDLGEQFGVAKIAQGQMTA